MAGNLHNIKLGTSAKYELIAETFFDGVRGVKIKLLEGVFLF